MIGFSLLANALFQKNRWTLICFCPFRYKKIRNSKKNKQKKYYYKQKIPHNVS